MNTWVHLHPWAAIVLTAFGAGFVGVLVMAVLVSGRDPADVREAERRAGHW